MITQEQLVRELRAVGVREGDLLNIKVSYKSIGEVEGGIHTLIKALLETVGKTGTIFTDSFVRGHLPIEMLISPKRCLVDQKTKSYAGAVANFLIDYPGALRSPHPIQKFVAIGADADIVLQHDLHSKPYSTLLSIAERGAKNLRIGSISKVVGVGTTHVAVGELEWKQRIIKSGVVFSDNGVLRKFYKNWPDACSVAFNNMMPLYRQYGAIINESKIGNAEAVLTDMQKTLKVEMMIGSQYPYFLKCSNQSCLVCNLEWYNSSHGFLHVLFHCLKKKDFKAFFKTILWLFVKSKTI